jgi:CDGSH-type Zn-finger protein
MPTYQHGKIYILRSHQTDKVYIGSTTQTLAQRRGQHINMYKRYENNKSNNYISSYDVVKYDDFYIELLELYPCNQKCELHAREGHYIRKMKCVNKCIPCRTTKQYYEDNKEVLREKCRVYGIAHTDTKREYNKIRYQRVKNTNHDKEVRNNYREQKYVCDCGMSIYKYCKSTHLKTKNHKTLLDNKNIKLSDEDMILKYICTCGIIVRKKNKNRHDTSKLHINIMTNTK